jgi:hypothetical protein
VITSHLLVYLLSNVVCCYASLCQDGVVKTWYVLALIQLFGTPRRRCLHFGTEFHIRNLIDILYLPSVCLLTDYTWSTGRFLRIPCYWTPSEIGTVWCPLGKQFNQRGDRAKYFLKIVGCALLHMGMVLWTRLPIIWVVLGCNFWSSIPEHPKRTTQHRLYLTSPVICNIVCRTYVQKPEN